MLILYIPERMKDIDTKFLCTKSTAFIEMVKDGETAYNCNAASKDVLVTAWWHIKFLCDTHDAEASISVLHFVAIWISAFFKKVLGLA